MQKALAAENVPLTALLALEGMHCASCAAAVERQLQTCPGVLNAQVSFASDSVLLEWNEAIAPLSSLKEAVRTLGYRLASDTSSAGDDRQITQALDMRIAAVLFTGMWVMFLSIPLWFGEVTDPQTAWALWGAANLFAIPGLLYGGWPFYRVGWLTLKLGAPGMDALVLLGVGAAVLLSLLAPVRDHPVTYVDMALTLLAGQLVAKRIDLCMRQQSKVALETLLAQAPSMARLLRADGTTDLTPVAQLVVGDHVELFAGEAVSVDGVVLQGRGYVDRASRTGESDLHTVGPTDLVFAGDIVTDARVVVEVQARAGRRWLDRLSGPVKSASTQKGDWHKLADRYAKYFVPVAALLALAGGGVAVLQGNGALVALDRALAVFVIACPCALSVAAPFASRLLTIRLARCGIQLRDPMAIERFRRPGRVFLDKTGTLTSSDLSISKVHTADGMSAEDLLMIASQAVYGSNHPVACAIQARTPHAQRPAGEFKTVPGDGQRWTDLAGNVVVVGRSDWLEAEGIRVPALAEAAATRTHVARNGTWLGAIDLTAHMAPGTIEAVAALGTVAPVEILSGDRAPAVALIAEQLDVPFAAIQSPSDKLKRVTDARNAGAYVVFTGDGLNDAPALAGADLGIAVAGCSDLAKVSATAVVERGGLEQVGKLLSLLGKAREILRQNLFWALAYNAIAALLAIAGWVHPAMAALAMVLSSLTVLLNAARLLRA